MKGLVRSMRLLYKRRRRRKMRGLERSRSSINKREDEDEMISEVKIFN